MVFSCDKYDKIRRKPFNAINEVDNLQLQIGINIEIDKIL